MTAFERFLRTAASGFNEYLESGLHDGTHPDMARYLYVPLSQYTANAGKRHRPLICILACEAVGGQSERAWPAAAAIEHFHTAALIHDDIMDCSLTRRGEPCMHVTEGEALAINAGDLALSLVTGTVVKAQNLEPVIRLRVLEELVDMTTRTIEGQALDIGWARDNRFDLTVDDYLLMANHKTAFYSGAVPLAVGAIVGGGTEAEIEALRDFGMATGLAFQIQDDILNLVGTREATGKDFRSDITEGKRTLAVVHALEYSAEGERLRLLEILASHTEDAAIAEEAVAIMTASGSIAFARTYARDLVLNAKDALEAALPQSDSRDLLLSMADFFIERDN